MWMPSSVPVFCILRQNSVLTEANIDQPMLAVYGQHHLPLMATHWWYVQIGIRIHDGCQWPMKAVISIQLLGVTD